MATIVMTGGTSGLGEVAARRIAAAPGAALWIGARQEGSPHGEVLPLDLADLDGVRRFAEAVRRKVPATGIDALALNAGLAFHSDDQRTAAGYETTFAVNHLGHYLLLRLLMPALADGATVVLTTSATHDPAAGAILPTPRHADARLLARPELDPERDEAPRTAGGRAYTASKLCNVLTARALAVREDMRQRGVRAIAYAPGPTPGTGLARGSGAATRAIWRLLGTPLGRLVPVMTTREDAGTWLGDLALGAIAPPPGRVYASLRRRQLEWTDPSELARDDEVRDALWRDSADLLGLPA